jgi:ATP-dependent protease ClpP protease subunit
MLNNDGNIFFVGDFDDNAERELVIPLTKEIQKQRKRKDGRIDLYINSFGGYVHLVEHLVGLVEIAKSNGITVRTIVPACAYSAGSMLAITGTPGERYIAKTAEHLIHYGMIGSAETTPTQIERNTAWKTRSFNNAVKHYERYSDVPDLREKIKDDGFFVTSRDAIKWGLADKTMEKFDIGDHED